MGRGSRAAKHASESVMINLPKMSPVELILELFKDSGNAAKYRREIEKRIGKKFYEVSGEDMKEFLFLNPISEPTSELTTPLTLFKGDGTFLPFPREDFSSIGAWRIAEAILKTDWEGCYTKTQDPYDNLMTLQRIRDRRLVVVDDFDSDAHANLFRVIIGEFNKWASKKYSGKMGKVHA